MSFEGSSQSNIAISVKNLSKVYHIYSKPSYRLKQLLLNFFRRLFKLKPMIFYNEFWALRDVSFELSKGQTLGVVGMNGAGKSTLLQVITGVLSPSSGEIEVNGRIAALLELGSGFNPEFTGRENVYLNASILGLSTAEIDERYDSICEFAEIGDFIDRPIKTYSSGMIVRLAFAVVVHVDADILIIDEALAVGDAHFSQKCMRFLRNFMEKGSVLFVSHDAGAVANLCDKALYLERGSRKMLDTPKKVTERYLQDLYLISQGLETSCRLNSSGEPSANSELPLESPTAPYPEWQETVSTATSVNQIELFSPNKEPDSYGMRGATINNIIILNSIGEPLAWINGGSNIILKISATAHMDLHSPIVGFQIKDKLGQIIFSDNTFKTYQHRPLTVNAGANITAFFHFYLPELPHGEYAVSPAIATGTQQEHVQHHWIHDALIMNVRSTNVPGGLIGLNFSNIEMRIEGRPT